MIKKEGCLFLFFYCITLDRIVNNNIKIDQYENDVVNIFFNK